MKRLLVWVWSSRFSCLVLHTLKHTLIFFHRSEAATLGFILMLHLFFSGVFPPPALLQVLIFQDCNLVFFGILLLVLFPEVMIPEPGSLTRNY